MKPFVPKRLEPYLFGLLLSGMMSFIVSGLAIYLAVSDLGQLVAAWPRAWLSSWLIAFPAVLVVAPITRKIVKRLVKAD